MAGRVHQGRPLCTKQPWRISRGLWRSQTAAKNIPGQLLEIKGRYQMGSPIYPLSIVVQQHLEFHDVMPGNSHRIAEKPNEKPTSSGFCGRHRQPGHSIFPMTNICRNDHLCVKSSKFHYVSYNIKIYYAFIIIPSTAKGAKEASWVRWHCWLQSDDPLQHVSPEPCRKTLTLGISDEQKQRMILMVGSSFFVPIVNFLFSPTFAAPQALELLVVEHGCLSFCMWILDLIFCILKWSPTSVAVGCDIAEQHPTTHMFFTSTPPIT